MSLSTMIERWDELAYLAYDAVAKAKFLVDYPRYRKFLNKNKMWKDKYKGQKCFVVLNGPSIKQHDLSKLRNEYVFAVNTMYLSPIVNVIHPNFYCWSDSSIFHKESANVIKELLTKCSYSQFFFNKKALNILKDLPNNVHITYSAHMPNSKNVKANVAGLSSNFMTVAFYAINLAMYMGFSQICILGLDFPPGHFTHFSDDLGEANNPDDYDDKDTVCGYHWGYSVAQYQSYYLRKAADKAGTKIINTNSNSCIRAFEFGEFAKLI